MTNFSSAKQTNMKISTINGDSSSIKFALYQTSIYCGLKKLLLILAEMKN